jgi:manganese-dependent inorganic pyrophosphatase
MITDVVHENSVLLSDGLSRYEPKLAYTKESDHKFLLPGVLSRKKQLLPEILRVLEEG